MSSKFSPMRFTAATEEAAIEGALQLVGAARDEISYDFISQTAKGVTVRIRPREADDDEHNSTSAPADLDANDANEADAPLHLDSMNDFDAEDDDAEDDDAEDDADDETSDLSDLDDEADDELDFDASLELADDEYDEDDLDEDELDGDETEANADANEPEIDAEMLERALVLARAMLSKMGLDAQVERGQASAADTLPLRIEGEDVGILIGKHGATLQSFQYVMNLTLNNGDATATRVTVDAGNYRARRQESLEAVARGAAQRARRENRPIKLEPMPSNERRIVHDILQTEVGISTQSEGREPHRCVIVAPGQSDYNGLATRATGAPWALRSRAWRSRSALKQG